MHSKNQFRNLLFRGISSAVTAALALAIAFMLIAVASQPAQAQTTAITLPAQTFTTLHVFDGYDGAHPYHAGLVQATDGNLYGTTLLDGANGIQNAGTVFKITPSGTLTTIYNFCSLSGCTDGQQPEAALVQATDGNLYGTTTGGGANSPYCPNGSDGCGTVFQITPGGTLTTLYSFCPQNGCTDGIYPWGLVQATDGNFYGTTAAGGDTSCNFPTGCGTVFKITPSGTLTMHAFSGADGGIPLGGLVQATDGNFYGTTSTGGPPGNGTVFKITPSGTLTTIYSFCSQVGCTDGREVYGALIQAADGNLYGTTYIGGANSPYCPNGSFGCGTVFQITLGGTLTTLYSFCSQNGCTDGIYPGAGLVQATDRNFYGTTEFGGNSCSGFFGCGTIFKITPGGTLTTLYSFCSQSGCADGALPVAALVQDTNGNFYGTTFGNDVEGGAPFGTVFSLSVGLGPFVETLPTSGKVGTAVIILGNHLTGSTSVTFNGTAAKFTVPSNTEIQTTVPSGATTGKVKVTTPSRILTSKVKFRVTPTILGFSPTSGPVGTDVAITGESLSGATSVTFGGVRATHFTVDSYTEITATVPTGAKTGKIRVTTPGGTAASKGTFTVN
jgi:uncharacterized repeat protein (TIGR03803 family)